jgi:hypothetical protein
MVDNDELRPTANACSNKRVYSEVFLMLVFGIAFERLS